MFVVVSAESGAGKSTLCSWCDAFDEITVLSLPELEVLGPQDISPNEIVLIDGPSHLQGDGLSLLPLSWIKALDGFVVVARRRRTKVRDLRAMRSWFHLAGVPCVGVVLNEHRAPRRAFWRAWAVSMSRWFVRRNVEAVAS